MNVNYGNKVNLGISRQIIFLAQVNIVSIKQEICL